VAWCRAATATADDVHAWDEALEDTSDAAAPCCASHAHEHEHEAKANVVERALTTVLRATGLLRISELLHDRCALPRSLSLPHARVLVAQPGRSAPSAVQASLLQAAPPTQTHLLLPA
jgi:hypothetical protein